VCALALCTTIAAVAAPPQYTAVDFGPANVPGAALAWLIRKPDQTLAPFGWPAAGGSSCFGQPPVNELGARYGKIAVGATCLMDGGEEAALWTVNSDVDITLTTLGFLSPGAGGGIDSPFSMALNFNTQGEVVGQSNAPYPTYRQPSRILARHGFLYHNGAMTDLIPIAGVNYDSMAEGVNDSHEVVGQTDTISSTTGEVLKRAFLYANGTTYNLTFYLVGGPTVLLSDAYGIDCQGNIAAIGTPASGGNPHNYMLVRQGPARTNCPK
jgi:probable HAF family extracellular repeat protein